MSRHSPYYCTQYGKAYCSDSLDILAATPSRSVDLVITSPPFALRTKKSYGNVTAAKYFDWFWPFAKEIYRVLKNNGSFVLDIGGSWNKGQPTRNLYHFDLLLKLCGQVGNFNLAQEFYWFNPAKLPAPAQWVTIERIRVKDAVNPIWWLSKSTRPKASNRRVLKPYTESMRKLLKHGYRAGKRPSGHSISQGWNNEHNGAIPSNMIVAANTRNSDSYLDGCRDHNIEVHPARFPAEIPEFFINFLTRKNDLIIDPFGGSNVVGSVADSLRRRWVSVDINEEYTVGSSFRFESYRGPRVRNYLRKARK